MRDQQTETILAFSSPDRLEGPVMTAQRGEKNNNRVWNKNKQKKKERQQGRHRHRWEERGRGKLWSLTSCPPSRFWGQWRWQLQTPGGKPNALVDKGLKGHIYTSEGGAQLKHIRRIDKKEDEGTALPGWDLMSRNVLHEFLLLLTRGWSLTCTWKWWGFIIKQIVILSTYHRFIVISKHSVKLFLPTFLTTEEMAHRWSSVPSKQSVC